MTWLTGWTYRKEHIITGCSDGAQTSYQMKITVYKGTGSDSGASVYCNNNCNDDFGDIRFTDAASANIDYWQESYTSATSSIFWVEIPSIPISPGTINIYMYYGKAGQATSSSGTNTFIFFDHFTSVGAGWTQTGTPAIVNTTWLQLQAIAGGAVDAVTTNTFVIPANTPCVIEMSLYAVTCVSTDGYSDGRYPIMTAQTSGKADGLQWYNEGAYDRYVFANNTPNWKTGTGKGLSSGITVRNKWIFCSSDQRHIVSGDLTIDDTFTEDTDLADGNAYSIELGNMSNYSAQEHRIDFIFVRKYVSTVAGAEPTSTSWGPQAEGETAVYIPYLRLN